MVELVIGHDAIVADWVASQLPNLSEGFGPCTAIGVVENGRMIGGTVFHNFYRECGVIEMSSAAISARWLAPRMVRAIFGYVFDQLGCQMVIMQVSVKNDRMVGIARRFGFAEVLIPRLRGRNDDVLVFTLTDDQWQESPFRRD